ncbi:DUF1376 domain-containing protein (plasmid) [Azospirillum brasilense]|uniref:DUF1376 domain-containing protein n=2 Tax=Azospirillum TaxID=191 RepID=A0A4D8QUT2_AZOBR|nr:YdaU family protein [Azospirillum brasilense]YP_001686856.1 primosomal protein [Azospirillum phage Cd]MDW7555407.1 YdaU family protein [Azospirillum brasilense]MDW7595185.1 YdaU family protein [Azospirillum brasilense]MDW7630338.1 YdaU family protein [Azospirillum brasilense]MDX5949706.1 YdaU family protein [Azospirillum brasilense]OPH16841.1 hypothetical protein FE89_02460 [Azospirillum brasilense]
MSQAPSMPVFPDALIADTTDLNMEEFGAYCMILMVTWRNNGQALPDDPARLARVCRMTEKRWTERVGPVLARFFDLSEGVWRQHRLEKEWNFVAKQRASQSEKGKKSATAKALKNNETTSTAVDERCEPNANPQPQPHKELTLEAEASKATVIAFPLGQDPSPTKPQSQDLNALFSEWWQFVPRKVSKGQAEKAYRAAVKHTDPAELLAGIKRFATDCQGKDPQFVAHPATWLNGKRWLDEPGLPLNGGSNAQRHFAARETPEQATHRRREALANALARRVAAGGGGAGAH